MFEIYCTRCGRAQEKFTQWKCSCDGPFEIHHEIAFERVKIISHDQSVWRYRNVLYPIEPQSIISLGEGMTPLTFLENPTSNTYVKLEYVGPTGSLKDRGVTMMVSHMHQMGVKKVHNDSSGNAGASIAAYCAHASIECEIFVPENVRVGKATQIRAYGAKLRRIPGDRTAAALAAREAASQTYYTSQHWNPFYLHGKETMAFEIVEQLNWSAPDIMIMPMGSGSTVYGAYKGFKTLKDADIIDSFPKLIGVQPSKCAPAYTAITGQAQVIKEPINTVADGLSIKSPIRLEDMIKAMKEVKAEVEVVTDSEIIEGLRTLGHRGFFVEPTSAVVHAAWKKQLNAGKIDKESYVVLVLTGIGLKATTKWTSMLPELES